MLRATLLTLEQKGKTGRIERRRGSREFAYCIRGHAALIVDAQRHELREGDGAILDDMPATAWENLADGRTEIILVSARLP